MSASPQLAQKVCQELIARGLLVEAGFSALRSLIPMNASQAQIDAMRTAFFAGASHVFHSVLVSMDTGAEPTEADMSRLSQLHSELQRFEAELAKMLPTRGNA